MNVVGRITFAPTRRASSAPDLAFPKPTPRAAVQRAKQRHRHANTSAVRADVMARDGYRCRICRRDQFVELAHLVPKGTGGDHGVRTTRANTIACCATCHRGPRPSLHAGGITWEPRSDRGADGTLVFHVESEPAR